MEEIIDRENRLGRMMDYGVISGRVDALYASSARALGEPRLLDLIVDGTPAYAWPADQRHVWRPQPQRRLTSLIEFLTRPRNSHIRGGQVLKSTRRPGCVQRNARAASMVIRPFVSVGEHLPVDLYDSEKERRADAEQQHTVHRL